MSTSEYKTAKQIPLTQGKIALVDDADFEKVTAFKWFAHFNGERWYAGRMFQLPDGSRTTQYMHRFIMGLEHGDPRQADHIDRDATLDNRRSNLRLTLNQNQQNVGKRKDNTSGYKGVRWHDLADKWQARIRVGKKEFSLGYFPTPELAAQAYDNAAIELHGEFAATNKSLGLMEVVNA